MLDKTKLLSFYQFYVKIKILNLHSTIKSEDMLKVENFKTALFYLFF